MPVATAGQFEKNSSYLGSDHGNKPCSSPVKITGFIKHSVSAAAGFNQVPDSNRLAYS